MYILLFIIFRDCLLRALSRAGEGIALGRAYELSFGVSLPTFCGGGFGDNYISLQELRNFVTTAERLGFSHFWHVDRLMGVAPPAYNTSWYEPMTTLASITPFIKNARIGTAVINITYRNPVVFAKQVASLDRLSGGRLTIGVGQGWNKAELAASNVSSRDRVRRFEEATLLLRRLLTEKRVSHSGEFWRLDDFYLEPRPIQQPCPPILVAGGGDGIHFEKTIPREVVDERIFRRVAQLGDGWIARTDTSPAEIEKYINMLRRFLPEYGKSIENFMIAHQNFVFVIGRSGSEHEARERLKKLSRRTYDEVVRRYIIGRPAEVSERIKMEAKAGVKQFIVMPVGVDYEVLHFFAEEVMPQYTP